MAEIKAGTDRSWVDAALVGNAAADAVRGAGARADKTLSRRRRYAILRVFRYWQAHPEEI